MTPTDAEVFLSNVSEIIGVQLEMWEYEDNGRGGVKFQFPGWPPETSPIFSIRRSGIMGAIVSLEFGRLAGNCIQILNSQINLEKIAFASAVLTELNKSHKFEGGLSSEFLETLKFKGNTRLQFRYRNFEVNSSMEDAVEKVLKPLVASIAYLMESPLDEEIVEGDEEGDSLTVTHKRRERSARNRMLAIMIHGEVCGVCGLEPIKEFGEELGNIIEVHHIEPLCELKEVKAYDPETDLVPVCPNCHRMLHTRKPAYTPQELIESLKE